MYIAHRNSIAIALPYESKENSPATPRNNLSFSVIFSNIRSFLRKREHVSNLMSSSASNLLVLTETWLTSEISDAEVLADLPNFDVYRCDRRDARGGGVLIAVNQQLPCTRVNMVSELEILWLKCQCSPRTVLLGVCYRPPHRQTEFSNLLTF